MYAFGSGEASDEPLLVGKTLVDGRPAAYVCERFACQSHPGRETLQLLLREAAGA